MKTCLAIALTTAAASAFAQAQVPEGKWVGIGQLQRGSNSSCGGDATYELTISGTDVKGKASAPGTVTSIQGTVLSDTELTLTMKEWDFKGLPAKYEGGEIKFLQNGRNCKFAAVLKPSPAQ